MERRGFTVRVYNDLFRKKNIKQFNPNLEIAYWSYDGDTENKRVSKANRTYRAGAAGVCAAVCAALAASASARIRPISACACAAVPYTA